MLRTVCELLKPTVRTLGYALFLAVNATGIWGGVFPFLPMEIQTADVMLWFYLAQSVMLVAVFVTVGAGCYVAGQLPLRPSMRAVLSAGVYFTGWLLLIAAMYLDAFLKALAVAGGLFLGLGAGLFYLQWQRLFAAEAHEERGMRDLILAFVYSAVFYGALYLVPRAVTAYLIPLVFLPLFALALIIANRSVDTSQPMFAEKPRENRRVYRAAIASMWRSAVLMGAIAFCTGIMRSIAIEQPEIGTTVNLLSMATLFAAALFVLLFWQFKGVRMNVTKLYRIVFPLLVTAFAVLPFAGLLYTRWLAAGLYALYSIGLLLMSIQCAQAARDRGVNPSFVFGVYGGIVYGLHDIGFIAGSVTDAVAVAGLSQLAFSAVLAMYLLALMFFFSVVDFRDSARQLFYGDTIELVAPRHAAASAAGHEHDELDDAPKARGALEQAGAGAGVGEGMPGVSDALERDHAGADGADASGRVAAYESGGAGEADGGGHEQGRDGRGGQDARGGHGELSDDDGQVYRDRIDKQVALARDAYGLSMRESEVVALVMHGCTVGRIAELLFISENTVRTHMKRIYVKLDVHKKAELIALVEQAHAR